MRVLIAGASGAIGRPLVRCLKENRHTVFGLTRSPQSSHAVAELGAEPVNADALDAVSVKAAIVRVRPDAVINELTSLPRHYTAAEMKVAAARDYQVRIARCRRTALSAAKLGLLVRAGGRSCRRERAVRFGCVARGCCRHTQVCRTGGGGGEDTGHRACQSSLRFLLRTWHLVQPRRRHGRAGSPAAGSCYR